MANGDLAAAAGMDVVPSTAKARLGYDEINKTRDYIAPLPGRITAVEDATATRPRAWKLERTGSATDNFPAAAFASLANGTIASAPPGDYIVTGTVVVSNVSVQVGYLRLMAGGVNLSLDARIDPGPTPELITFTSVLEGFAGGNLNVSIEVQVAAGLGTVYKNGTGVRVAYLGART